MDNDVGLTTYELASFTNRFLAYVIDIIILSVISFFILMLIDGFITSLIQLWILDVLISGAYYWYFWTRNNGQTPGKQLLKIRVIKTDGSALSDTDALLRVFGYYVGRIALFLGYVWAAFDENNQGWHDKMANTYVVTANPDSKKTISI